VEVEGVEGVHFVAEFETVLGVVVVGVQIVAVRETVGRGVGVVVGLQVVAVLLRVNLTEVVVGF
jgi:hypothetical protein